MNRRNFMRAIVGTAALPAVVLPAKQLLPVGLVDHLAKHYTFEGLALYPENREIIERLLRL